MAIDDETRKALLEELEDLEGNISAEIQVITDDIEEIREAVLKLGESGPVADSIADIRKRLQATEPPPGPDPDPDPPTPGARKPFRAGFNADNTKRNRILDPSGRPFVAMGPNMFPFWGATYLDKYNPTGIPDLRRQMLDHVDRMGANIARIVTQTGQDRTKWAWNCSPRVHRQLVEACIAKGIVPMLEMHDSTTDRVVNPHGFYDPAITTYWLSPEVIAMLIANPECWVNIANEANFRKGSEVTTLGHVEAWVAHYNGVIKQLRAKGVKNLIVVDSGGTFAQDHTFILNGGKRILDADPEHNVVMSWHMYQFWQENPQRWPTGQFAPSVEIPKLASLDVPVILGEFGWHQPAHSDIPYNAKQVFDLCEANGIGTCFWADFDGLPRYNLVNDLVSARDGLGPEQLTPAGEALVPYWQARREARRARFA